MKDNHTTDPELITISSNSSTNHLIKGISINSNKTIKPNGIKTSIINSSNNLHKSTTTFTTNIKEDILLKPLTRISITSNTKLPRVKVRTIITSSSSSNPITTSNSLTPNRTNQTNNTPSSSNSNPIKSQYLWISSNNSLLLRLKKEFKKIIRTRVGMEIGFKGFRNE